MFNFFQLGFCQFPSLLPGIYHAISICCFFFSSVSSSLSALLSSFIVVILFEYNTYLLCDNSFWWIFFSYGKGLLCFPPFFLLYRIFEMDTVSFVFVIHT